MAKRHTLTLATGVIRDKEFLSLPLAAQNTWLRLCILSADLGGDGALVYPMGDPLTMDEIQKHLGYPDNDLAAVESFKASLILLERVGGVVRTPEGAIRPDTERWGWGDVRKSARPSSTKARVARHRAKAQAATATTTPATPGPRVAEPEAPAARVTAPPPEPPVAKEPAAVAAEVFGDGGQGQGQDLDLRFE